MSIKIKISIIAICFALVAAVCIGFVFASPNETINMNGMINYEVPKITITASPNDSNLGSTNGSGDYSIGDTINLSATHSGSNSFLAWATSLDPNTMEILSTSTTYSFELAEDSPTTYYALFNSTISTSQTVRNLIYTFYNEAKLASVSDTTSTTLSGAFEIPSVVSSGENSYKVYSIDSYAFYNCSSLTSISIPKGVTEIGGSAFRYCSSLTEITIPDGVTEIEGHVFDNCSKLTSITIPDGVTAIGDFAFTGCSNLTSITIPSTLTSIGERAFSGCRSLTTITIPEGVTSIGSYAFRYCSGLTKIIINGNISTMETDVFYNCSNLTSLTLGAGVESLPSNLFTSSNLANLTEIVVEEGSTLNVALPSYATWYKGDSQTPVTSFSGEGTYTKS